MLTVVKFFRNLRNSNRNPLISRTLLKIAHINRDWDGEQPLDNEIWLVKIVAETHHGKPQGCFIVDPIDKVNIQEDLLHLPPTLFSMKKVHDTPNGQCILLVTPAKPDSLWILPKSHKRILAKNNGAYAVVVDHGGAVWF